MQDNYEIKIYFFLIWSSRSVLKFLTPNALWISSWEILCDERVSEKQEIQMDYMVYDLACVITNMNW